MSRSRDLSGLITQLEEADSPFEKLHQLALAWRSVRELSPDERRELARHAGFDGAGELIEGLARRRGGLAPALLLQAIERARNADPSLLREIFQRLRDPQGRMEVVTEGLRAVASALMEPKVEDHGAAPEEPPAPPGTGAPSPDGEPSGENASHAAGGAAPEEPTAAPEAPAARPPAAQPPQADAGPAVEPSGPTATVGGEPQPGGAQPGQAGATPAASPAEPAAAPGAGNREPDPPAAGPPVAAEPLRPTPAPPAGGTPGARPADRTPTAPAPTRAVAAGTRTGSLEALLGKLAEPASASRRLRLLRQAGLPPLTTSEARRLLEAFPQSWARRRAFCLLADRGLLDRLTSPAALLDGLSPADRTWCLAALARRTVSGSHRLEELIRLAPSPAMRRRLVRLAQTAEHRHG